ncbi:hypothetical protein SRHO_G00124230 [Serrasalmus rhombeus]
MSCTAHKCHERPVVVKEEPGSSSASSSTCSDASCHCAPSPASVTSVRNQASPTSVHHGTPTELQAHTQLGTHGFPEVLEWVPVLQSELWKSQMCHQSGRSLELCNLRKAVLCTVHVDAGVGHFHLGKTVKLLQQRSYWLSYSTDVELYVLLCDQCTAKKGRSKSHVLLQSLCSGAWYFAAH